MRALFVILHRWFGLLTALFLFVAGLTGALISWDHELDEALNPAFYHRAWQGQTPQDPLQLAKAFEQAHPDLQVSFLPLSLAPDEALNLFVDTRAPSTALPIHNQLALDPISGSVQAERYWGAISLDRENLLPFLYKLHYSLHIPDGFGLELGVWLFGVVGIVWALDCFLALWISFPSVNAWRKSFGFRWRAGGYKLNFDLHRSGGVWLWPLLLLLAVTSVSMNLGFEVVRPLVNRISPLTPSPFEVLPVAGDVEPLITREQIIAQAKQDAPSHGISEPVGGIFYNKLFNVYGVGFFTPGNSHGDGGLGNAWLYYRGDTGAAAGADIPGAGSAGDLFMQLQFPLHSGRIAGVYGRAFMSVLGLAVAVLSVTGVVIWLRKKRARRKSLRSQTNQAGSETLPTVALP